MESIPQPLTRKINLNDILLILRGVRNGIYYGGKVRFMHSFVMALTFMRGSLKERILRVYTLTKEHSLSLGLYVGLYKTVVMLLEKLTLRNSNWYYFIAGLVSGYMVYRDGSSSINQQIIMYLLSRDLIGGAKNLQEAGVLPKVKFFSILAAMSWGVVMLLFEDNKKTLQKSLASSMDFLYHQSDQINSWTDFVPIYIPVSMKAIIERYFLKMVHGARRIGGSGLGRGGSLLS